MLVPSCTDETYVCRLNIYIYIYIIMMNFLPFVYSCIYV